MARRHARIMANLTANYAITRRITSLQSEYQITPLVARPAETDSYVNSSVSQKSDIIVKLKAVQIATSQINRTTNLMPCQRCQPRTDDICKTMLGILKDPRKILTNLAFFSRSFDLMCLLTSYTLAVEHTHRTKHRDRRLLLAQL